MNRNLLRLCFIFAGFLTLFTHGPTLLVFTFMAMAVLL